MNNYLYILLLIVANTVYYTLAAQDLMLLCGEEHIIGICPDSTIPLSACNIIINEEDTISNFTIFNEAGTSINEITTEGTYAVEDAEGSIGSIVIELFMNPTITLSAYTLNVCSEAPIPLITASVDNSVTIASWEWFISGDSTALGAVHMNADSINEVDIDLNGSVQATSYTVIATTTQGCSSTANVMVNTIPVPNLTVASSSINVCENENVTLIAESSDDNLTWMWIYPNGYLALNAEPTLTIDYDDIIIGDYNVRVTDDNGCNDMATITLVSPPSSTVDISFPDEVCEGESLVISIITEDGIAYTIHDVDGSTIATETTNNGDYTDFTIASTALSVGNNIFTIEASNGDCSVQLTEEAEIMVHALPDTTLDLYFPNEICMGEVGIISITEPQDDVTYTIHDVLGTTTIAEGIVNGDYLDFVILSDSLAEGDNWFVVEAFSNDCSVQLIEEALITVQALPSTTLNVSNEIYRCNNADHVTITINDTEVGVSYQILNTNEEEISISIQGTGDNIDIDVPTYYLNNAIDYLLVQATLNNCHVLLNDSVVIYDNTIDANIIAYDTSGIHNDNIVCFGDAILLAIDEGYTYNWGLGDTSVNYTIILPENTLNTYSVTITDANNCTASSTITILGEDCCPTINTYYSNNINYCANVSQNYNLGLIPLTAFDYTGVSSPTIRWKKDGTTLNNLNLTFAPITDCTVVTHVYEAYFLCGAAENEEVYAGSMTINLYPIIDESMYTLPDFSNCETAIVPINDCGLNFAYSTDNITFYDEMPNAIESGDSIYYTIQLANLPDALIDCTIIESGVLTNCAGCPYASTSPPPTITMNFCANNINTYDLGAIDTSDFAYIGEVPTALIWRDAVTNVIIDEANLNLSFENISSCDVETHTYNAYFLCDVDDAYEAHAGSVIINLYPVPDESMYILPNIANCEMTVISTNVCGLNVEYALNDGEYSANPPNNGVNGDVFHYTIQLGTLPEELSDCIVTGSSTLSNCAGCPYAPTSPPPTTTINFCASNTNTYDLGAIDTSDFAYIGEAPTALIWRDAVTNVIIDEANLNLSFENISGCDVETYTYNAYFLCDVDDAYEAHVGSVSINLYPSPNENMYVLPNIVNCEVAVISTDSCNLNVKYALNDGEYSANPPNNGANGDIFHYTIQLGTLPEELSDCIVTGSGTLSNCAGCPYTSTSPPPTITVNFCANNTNTYDLGAIDTSDFDYNGEVPTGMRWRDAATNTIIDAANLNLSFAPISGCDMETHTYKAYFLCNTDDTYEGHAGNVIINLFPIPDESSYTLPNADNCEVIITPNNGCLLNIEYSLNNGAYTDSPPSDLTTNDTITYNIQTASFLEDIDCATTETVILGNCENCPTATSNLLQEVLYFCGDGVNTYDLGAIDTSNFDYNGSPLAGIRWRNATPNADNIIIDAENLNLSFEAVSGCAVETYTYHAYFLCSGNDDYEGYAGSVTVNLYAVPNNDMYVLPNVGLGCVPAIELVDDCVSQLSVQYSIDNINYSPDIPTDLQNDDVLNYQISYNSSPDNIDVCVLTGNFIVDFCCELATPNINVGVTEEYSCHGELPDTTTLQLWHESLSNNAIIMEEQTATNIEDSIYYSSFDANAANNSNVYSNINDLNVDNNNSSCEISLTTTIFAYLKCTEDVISTYIPIAEYYFYVYPEISSVTVTTNVTNFECQYFIEDGTCNFNQTLVHLMGYEGGMVLVNLEGLGGCEESFSINLEPCNYCPTLEQTVYHADAMSMCENLDTIETVNSVAINAAIEEWKDDINVYMDGLNSLLPIEFNVFTYSTVKSNHPDYPKVINDDFYENTTCETVVQTLYAYTNCMVDNDTIPLFLGEFNQTIFPNPDNFKPVVNVEYVPEINMCAYTVEYDCLVSEESSIVIEGTTITSFEELETHPFLSNETPDFAGESIIVTLRNRIACKGDDINPTVTLTKPACEFTIECPKPEIFLQPGTEPENNTETYFPPILICTDNINQTYKWGYYIQPMDETIFEELIETLNSVDSTEIDLTVYATQILNGLYNIYEAHNLNSNGVSIANQILTTVSATVTQAEYDSLLALSPPVYIEIVNTLPDTYEIKQYDFTCYFTDTINYTTDKQYFIVDKFLQETLGYDGYWVETVNIDNCTYTSHHVAIDFKNNAAAQADKVLVFPNPNNGTFSLNWSSTQRGVATVQLFNLMGTRVFQQHLNKTDVQHVFTVQTQGLTAGIYILQTNIKGNATQQKIVVY